MPTHASSSSMSRPAAADANVSSSPGAPLPPLPTSLSLFRWPHLHRTGNSARPSARSKAALTTTPTLSLYDQVRHLHSHRASSFSSTSSSLAPTLTDDLEDSDVSILVQAVQTHLDALLDSLSSTAQSELDGAEPKVKHKARGRVVKALDRDDVLAAVNATLRGSGRGNAIGRAKRERIIQRTRRRLGLDQSVSVSVGLEEGREEDEEVREALMIRSSKDGVEGEEDHGGEVHVHESSSGSDTNSGSASDRQDINLDGETDVDDAEAAAAAAAAIRLETRSRSATKKRKRNKYPRIDELDAEILLSPFRRSKRERA